MKYGYTINDRYIYRKPLGKGANGSVFYAYDNKLEKYWAVKACNTLSHNELEALKKVDYYTFPRLVDVCTQDNTCFLVMDYLEGTTLAEYCKLHTITEKQLIIWAIRLANALSYLHNMNPSMLYMDCKPENILVTPSGDIRLIDFGSVFVCDNTNNTISGTRFYAPLEIKKTHLHSNIGVSTDIYCLGMTLYKILTGSNTEYRDSNGNLCIYIRNRKISMHLCEIIQRCTAIKPSQRYQSMNDVVIDLRKISKSSTKLSTSFPRLFKQLSISLIQIYLASFVLLSANTYHTNHCPEYLLMAISLFCLLIHIAPNKNTFSLETKEDIFKRVTL